VPHGLAWCVEEIAAPAGFEITTVIGCTDKPLIAAATLTVADQRTTQPTTPPPKTPGRPVRTDTGELPRTGVAVVRVAAAGGALLAAGTAITFAGRRRRQRA